MKINFFTMLLLIFFSTIATTSQVRKSKSSIIWTKVLYPKKIKQKKVTQNDSLPVGFVLYNLNIRLLKEQLKNAESRYAVSPKGKLVSIPNMDGKLEWFEVYEDSNLDPELQKMFPDIRSYFGVSIKDKSTQLKLSMDPSGIQTMVLRADKKTEFIESFSEDGKTYALYNTKRKKNDKFECGTTTKLNKVKD